MAQQLNNTRGIRGMGDLVNNPQARQYLPAQYQTMLHAGRWPMGEQIYQQSQAPSTTHRCASWPAIPVAVQRLPARLASSSTPSAKHGSHQSRGGGGQAYNTASQRFSDIQVLLDRINLSPDAKDIADLSARIQAEQVMMQNEATKLQSLAMLVQAQKDIMAQSGHPGARHENTPSARAKRLVALTAVSERQGRQTMKPFFIAALLALGVAGCSKTIEQRHHHLHHPRATATACPRSRTTTAPTTRTASR